MTPATSGRSKPTYHRIADDIRAKIRSGRYDDAPVPPETDLAETYQVSIGTVQKALRVLTEEGLITRRPKVGTWVRQSWKIVRDGPGRVQGTVPEFLKRDVRDHVLEVTHFKSGYHFAESSEADLLDCFGDVRLVYRRRLYVVDDKPVQIATNYMPAFLFPDGGEAIIQPDPGPGGIWGHLAAARHPVVSADEFIDTRPPTPEETEELQLKPGTSVFVITRTALDANERVVDLGIIVLSGAAVRLRYRVLDKT